MRRSVALGAVALVSMLLAAGVARGQDPVAWLPPGAHAVVAADDPAGFWNRLSSTGLYAALAAGREREAPGAWVRLLGQRAGIAFYGDTEKGPDVAVVADVSEPAAARIVLAAMESRLKDEKGASFSDDRLGDTAIRVARDSAGDEVLFWAMIQNRLVAGTTRARLGQSLELSRGRGASMAADPRWQEASAGVGPAAIVAWADLSGMRGAQAERAQMLGRSVAVGVRWADDGLIGDARLEFDPAAAPGALAGSARMPLRSPDVAPGGTILLLSLPLFDAEAIARSPVLAAGVSAFEAKSGIDVESELLPALGREVTLAVLGVDVGFPFPLPRVALAIEARDEAALREVFAKLERWAVDDLRARQSIAIEWQEESHEGGTIRYAPTPLGERLEPAYAVAAGYLVAGSGRAAVRAVLDARAGRAATLASQSDFAPMAAFLPDEAGGAIFADIAAIAAHAREMGSLLGWSPGEEGGVDVLAVLENAPRLGIWWEPGDRNAIRLHGLLEVR